MPDNRGTASPRPCRLYEVTPDIIKTQVAARRLVAGINALPRLGLPWQTTEYDLGKAVSSPQSEVWVARDGSQKVVAAAMLSTLLMMGSSTTFITDLAMADPYRGDALYTDVLEVAVWFALAQEATLLLVATDDSGFRLFAERMGLRSPAPAKFQIGGAPAEIAGLISITPDCAAHD